MGRIAITNALIINEGKRKKVAYNYNGIVSI
jgi:hypothetical protein